MGLFSWRDVGKRLTLRRPIVRYETFKHYVITVCILCLIIGIRGLGKIFIITTLDQRWQCVGSGGWRHVGPWLKQRYEI